MHTFPGDSGDRPGQLAYPFANGSGEITGESSPNGIGFTDWRAQKMWVRITGQASSTNRYSWVVVDLGDKPTFAKNYDASFSGSGGTGVDQRPAYELEGKQTVPTNAVVEATPVGAYLTFRYGPAGGGDPTCYDLSPSTTATAVTARSTQRLTVPRANYLVTAAIGANYAAGAAITRWLIGRCNAGASPTNPKLLSSPNRHDAVSGAFQIITINQLMKTGDYDDDGTTANIDFSVYLIVASGALTIFDAKTFTALKVA